MIFIKDVEGKDLAVKFYHVMQGEKRKTVCEILSVPAGEVFLKGKGRVIAKGTTHVYETDNYDRPKGRTLAFGRAVNKFASKELRTLLWDEYKKNCKADFTYSNKM